MKQIEIEVTYKVTIDVNEESPIVREYESDKELISDLVHYRFTTLPVLNNGVSINDFEVINFTSTT